MRFKRIDLQGFKSFADPVTIEFNEGITGIVGPNGSGKSNISDAIRWVLGEQSPKMLRGGKMEEVIFSGTSTRKSRGMAEVTLVIDNSEGSLPIDYSEVAITRRMFRSGESEYSINGNQCRLKDIRDLIMDTGIGVDGYSLIGQGKIADIISSRTEDRREIFEEAAGIVAYRTRKAQAERRLASTAINMDRVKDIIGEIEGRIDGLREDSIKAREYLKLRERQKELEINIILKNIDSLELKNEYASDDLAEVDLQLSSTREERAELEKTAAGTAEKRTELDAAEEETRRQLLAAVEELNAITSKSEVDSQRLSAIEENVARLEEEEESLRQKAEREEENLRSVEKEKQALQAEAEKASLNLEEKVRVYNEAASEMAELSRMLDDSRNGMFDLSGKISSAKSEIASLERLRETLIRRRESLEEDRAAGRDSGERNREDLQRAEEARNEAAEQLETRRRKKQELEKQIAEARAEEKRISARAEELRVRLGQLGARKKTIEEMEHNYEGYNGAVRFVMRSGISGIRGVVADLISVPKGYETAIETALGASLQNIICEDDRSAREAILELKKNSAGRMTFLPLESIRGDARYDGNLKSERGFIGFGPECISCDPEYEEIAKYLLGRVVVADHIDNAIRISKKGRGMRVVTLDGEIINSAGAITGGRYRHKTADILQRKAEIRSLQEEITEGGKEQAEKEEALRLCRESIASMGAGYSTLDGEIRTGEQELLIRENEIRLAQSALSELRSGEEKLDREMDSIRQELARSAEMIEKLTRSVEEDGKAYARAGEESEELLARQEEKKAGFDAISEDITAARITASGYEEKLSHFEYVIRSLRESGEQTAEEILIRQEQRGRYLEEKQELTAGHENVDELIREKEEGRQRIQTYLDEISEEKRQVSEEAARAEAERSRLAEKTEDLQQKKYQLDIRKAKNETQLQTYKDRLWEDFEISYIQAMDFRADHFVMSTAMKENRQIKNRIRELGEVNVGAIEEYDTVRERHEFLTAQQEDIQKAMDSLTSIIKDMDRTIRERFRESFDKIVVNFEEIFTELFGGGHAELRLADENDPLTSDIDIVAQPPGKKLQNINLLSGGEKTLTAIALMFAVLKVKPTPFCILDEVEAALDDANIDRFISVLRKFEGIQFALVTHQKTTMEHTDVLYGVTMPEKGISRILSLDMADDFKL